MRDDLLAEAILPPSLFQLTFVTLFFQFIDSQDMLQLILAATLSGATLTSALSSVKRQDAGSVEWSKCEFDWEAAGTNQFKLPIQCGTLEVPLDYTDDGNDETLRLDLVRIPATKEPILGSMLYNPGGPGESGIENCIGNAQNLQIASGGQYDIGEPYSSRKPRTARFEDDLRQIQLIVLPFPRTKSLQTNTDS